MRGDPEAPPEKPNDPSPPTNAKMEVSKKYMLFYALGIFVCYFVYGILQEKITKANYGDPEKPEKFTHTLALVFVQCIINALFAKIVLFLNEPGLDTTPKKMYAACAVTYLGAMLASNHSLLHVAYPTQVLGKSVKPIPVMILGVLVARKRYPIQKYLFVMMIVLGVALFVFKDGKGSKSQTGSAFGFGEMLLVVSLTLDGLTGGIQDKIRANYKTFAHTMMLYMNVFSALILLTALTLTGEGFSFLGFVQRYPFVLGNMLLFSLASALGQNFIFLMVANFGPLMCSITTTTRKFFTILGSVLIFGHTMLARQWLGTCFVFTGLVLDNLYGKEKKGVKPAARAEKTKVEKD